MPLIFSIPFLHKMPLLDILNSEGHNSIKAVVASCYLLQFALPKTVQIAIFVYGNRLVVADAYHSLGLIGQIYANTTTFSLNVDKYDMMFWQHRVFYTTDAHLDSAIVDALNNGDVLLSACIYRIGNQLLHLLTAAYNCHARIYNLLDYIATMAAFEKLCCHNY